MNIEDIGVRYVDTVHLVNALGNTVLHQKGNCSVLCRTTLSRFLLILLIRNVCDCFVLTIFNYICTPTLL